MKKSAPEISLFGALPVLLCLLAGGGIPHSLGGGSGLVLLVSAGYVDQWPPLPQPNDIDGTVHGCADAILAHDIDGDGAIRRNEYLGFVNNVADLLCLPPRPLLDLELQSVFVSIACLCQEREGNGGVGGGDNLNDNHSSNATSCCLGDNAGLFGDGAGSVVGRTEDEQSYLRAACLWTQAVLGPEQCLLPTETLPPWAIPSFDMEEPLIVQTTPQERPDLLWLLLLLLLPLCFVMMCCCCCRRRNTKEARSVELTTVEERRLTIVGREADDDDDDEEEQRLSTRKREADDHDDEVEEEKKQRITTVGRETHDGDDDDDDDEEEEEESHYSAMEEQENSNETFDESSSVDALEEDVEAGRQGQWKGQENSGIDDEETFGKRTGLSQDDDFAEDGHRRFHGEGLVPNSPSAEGVRLRPIQTEEEEPGDYTCPERDFREFQYRREDSGQTVDHYVPDGGVYIPKRPSKDPVVLKGPTYRRPLAIENPVVDASKQRWQDGLGDGEVWDALANWEEQGEDSKDKAYSEGIDWVVQSMLATFTTNEENGELHEEELQKEEEEEEEEEGSSEDQLFEEQEDDVVIEDGSH